MEHVDILVVGAGAAGIAAARAAWEAGCRSILVVDRRDAMGGILLQCSHRGFGAELTGPEYAQKIIQDVPQGVAFADQTTVLAVNRDKTARLSGGRTVSFSQLIMATGCREVPFGALPIAGTRPRGIYTAGQLQEMINLHGFWPQGPVVILGSGDLGLIMAEQLARGGLKVTLVEQKDSCGGMARNQRCLKELPIALRCGVTVAKVHGYPLLESCRLSDGSRLPCRTLLIAAGLRPDRDLVRELKTEAWLHFCGNCSSVHAMVESVTAEGKRTGIAAWENIRGTI